MYWSLEFCFVFFQKFTIFWSFNNVGQTLVIIPQRYSPTALFIHLFLCWVYIFWALWWILIYTFFFFFLICGRRISNFKNILSSLLAQILANIIIFMCGNMAGAYHKHLMELALKQTYEDTCNCIKSPIKLEFEKRQQVKQSMTQNLLWASKYEAGAL